MRSFSRQKMLSVSPLSLLLRYWCEQVPKTSLDWQKSLFGCCLCRFCIGCIAVVLFRFLFALLASHFVFPFFSPIELPSFALPPLSTGLMDLSPFLYCLQASTMECRGWKQVDLPFFFGFFWPKGNFSHISILGFFNP